MARSALANMVFNTVYTGMRSITSSRGMSFEVRTFYDGSALINFNVTARNVTVTQSACITPVMEKDNKTVKEWRVSDDDKSEIVKDLGAAVGRIRSLVNDTRMILSKV